MSDVTTVKTIRLKESLLKKAEARANDSGHQNLSEYIRFLIQEDLRRNGLN